MQNGLNIVHLLYFVYFAVHRAYSDFSPNPCEFYGILSPSAPSEYFPNCTEIVGDMRVDSTSNMTTSQLEKFFKNIKKIRGKITVSQTSMKQLSFLKNVEIMVKDFYIDDVLEISENPFLTKINLSRLATCTGRITIKDNPQLDVSKHCRKFDELLDGNRMFVRNKADCGFQLDFPITFTSILNVPSNLTVIHGDIEFSNTAINPERLAVFQNVKMIYGCVTVENTNFETLAFLENLEEIVCRSETVPALKIVQNAYLEYLGLKKLRKISTVQKLDIVVNRILEVSFEEVDLLVTLPQKNDRVQGFFPSENLPPDMCKFNSVKDDINDISENCTTILGQLYYNGHSFSEQEIQKLQKIRKLYGNIDFEAMDVKDLSMFSNLEKIISLNESGPAIRLSMLKQLTSIELPKLEIAFAPFYEKFTIEQCASLAITNETCSYFEPILRQTLVVELLSCETWVEWINSLHSVPANP